MEQVCIVCQAPATREAKSQVAPVTAWVCGAVHARKFLRSVRTGVRAKAGAAALARGREQGEKMGGAVAGKIAPSPAEFRRGGHVDKRQLTFLGGKPVERR